MVLFSIAIVGFEEYNFQVVKSSKDMSQEEFFNLVTQIKEDQWSLIVRDPNVDYATELDLYDKILETLVDRYGFTKFHISDYSIRESSYEKEVRGSLIYIKTEGKEQQIALL